MRVADVEYTSGGQKRFERSQFEKTPMTLHAIVRRQDGKQDVVVSLDEKTAPLDGLVILSWIQSLLNDGLVPGFVRRYEVRDTAGERVLVNVYPLNEATGAVREVR